MFAQNGGHLCHPPTQLPYAHLVAPLDGQHRLSRFSSGRYRPPSGIMRRGVRSAGSTGAAGSGSVTPGEKRVNGMADRKFYNLPIKKPSFFLIASYIIIVDDKNYILTVTEETS